jgi:hypothetical protein
MTHRARRGAGYEDQDRGRNRAGQERPYGQHADKQDQIHADAEAIKLLAKRVPVLAFVNNHFAGYAPETLRQLAEALE